MANITYPWNPFQDNMANNITHEEIKVDAVNARKEFVPRYTPFFSRNFKLFKEGSNDPLKPGEDYVFAHPFEDFALDYQRNVFGSVVLLKPFDAVLYADYSTLGGPFTLNEGAFAALVANILSAPRAVDWSELVNVPVEWPTDPHDHPPTQTYDYIEFMTVLKSVVMGLNVDMGFSAKALLDEHLNTNLLEAHHGSKADFGLDLVANMAPALIRDLQGSSANLNVTMNVLKAAFRQLLDGTLILEEGEGEDGSIPTPPASIEVTPINVGGKITYSVVMTGGSSEEHYPITYRLEQQGPVAVLLSKTTGILPGEQVTFEPGRVTQSAMLTLLGYSVDSIGTSSRPVKATVMLTKTISQDDDYIQFFMGQL